MSSYNNHSKYQPQHVDLNKKNYQQYDVIIKIIGKHILGPYRILMTEIAI